jgi:hypothetical protein
VLTLLTLIVGAPTATADIAIERYVGGRPSDATAVLSGMRIEFARLGVLADARGLWLERATSLPRPGIIQPALTAAVIATWVDEGWQAYLDGKFQVSALTLESALYAARENPTLVIADGNSRQWMVRAMTALAMARARLAPKRDPRAPVPDPYDPYPKPKPGPSIPGVVAPPVPIPPDSALAAMAEQIRSFPERPVPKSLYGPDGVDLYEQTRAIMDGMPRGSLLISVNAPNAQISINELGRGREGTYTGDFYPGDYRVVVEVAGVSRRYHATISPGQQTKLLIDWATDSRFIQNLEWAGFLLPIDRPILPYARSLAARLPSDDSLVVYGIDNDDQGRRWVSGSRVSCLTGRPVVRARIEIEALGVTPSEKTEAALTALARYLVKGTPSPLIETFPHYVPDPLPRPLTASARVPSPRPSWGRTWAVAAAAAATAVAGTSFLLADSRGACGADHDDCTPLGSAKAWGLGLLSSSVSLAVIASLVYIDTRYPTAPILSVQPALTGATATMGWRF